MTLEEAKALLTDEYERAKSSVLIRDPIAYALYNTWKQADKQKLNKRRQTDLTGKCGSCAHAVPIKGSRKGVFGTTIECQSPDKVWKHECSKYKERTAPRCRLWKAREVDGK